MLSLRTKNGLNMKKITTLKAGSETRVNERIDYLLDSGLLIFNNSGNIALTDKGAVISDEIILEIVSEI